MHQTSAKNILVTGTVAFDHLFSYDASFVEKLKGAVEADVLSVSFNTHQYEKKFGGTGANIAWNLHLLQGNPLLVANIGKDGGEYVEFLKKAGMDISQLQQLDHTTTPTGVCCTDSREHQIWFFHHGADSEPVWPDLSSVRSDIAYAIVGPRHYERMLDALDWCKKAGVPVMFDPGQYILQFNEQTLRQAIEGCDGVIGNEFEWNRIHSQLGIGAAEVAKTVRFAIVTRGEQGFDIYTKEGVQSFPCCPCDKVVDPTGAGDAFRGGLLKGLAQGWSLEHAGKLGAALASFVLEQHGTLLESADTEKVLERAKKTYGNAFPESI